MILLKIISLPFAWAFTYSSIYNMLKFGLSIVSKIFWIFCTGRFLDLTFSSMYEFFSIMSLIPEILSFISWILLLRLAFEVSVWVPNFFLFRFAFVWVFFIYSISTLRSWNVFFIIFQSLLFFVSYGIY